MTLRAARSLVAVAAFLVALPASTSAADPAPGEPSTLAVRVEGLHSDTGRVQALVYRSADGFMRDPAKAVGHADAAISGGVAQLEFHGLPAGTYAVSCFHDENGNGKLDANWLGIPREGVGASNNAKGRMGPPKFNDARFTVAAPRTDHTIKVVYL